jgi:hypothetical protein
MSPTSPELPIDITPASPVEAARPTPSALENILGVMLFCGALALLFADVWYGKLVGLSDSDMRHATWLSGSEMDPWLVSFFGLTVPLILLMVGAGYGVAKNSPVPVLLATFTAALFSTVNPTSQFLLAEMTGQARIGCLDWSSRECRELLDVPVGNAPSILLKGATDDDCVHLTPGYEALERRVDAQRQSHGLEYLAHPSRMKAHMDAERAEITRFQASHGLSH